MDDSSYDFIAKIVILGESAVGKTNLLTRYAQNQFDSDAKATIGMDFIAKEMYVEGQSIKAQFWDTAGQEKYRSIARSYYKLADGIVLVYDVTRKETFKKLKGWLEDLHDNMDKKFQAILIGNKTDLISEREVSVEEGREFAASHGMFFWEASAKTNEGDCVNKAFDALLEECVREMVDRFNNEPANGFGALKKYTGLLDRQRLAQNKGKGRFCC